MNKNLPIALDFDGVVCDSIDECMVTAFNAWHRISGKSNNWITSCEQIPEQIQVQFRQMRYLVRPACHYGLLIEQILAGNYDLDQSEFNLLAERSKLSLDNFERNFFDCRMELRQREPTHWLNLHRDYPANKEWLTQTSSERIYIVTTKDEQSVRKLSNHFGFAFNESQIWDKDRTTNKADAIFEIAKICKCMPEHISFVDDHPDHLALVAERTGAKCYWASWGYSPSTSILKNPPFTRINSLGDLSF